MHSTADFLCIQCHVNHMTLDAPNQNNRLAPLFVGRNPDTNSISSSFSNNTAAMRIHPGSSSPNGVGVAINGSDVANVAVATNGGTNGSDCNGSTRTAAMVVAETAVELTAEAQLYRMKVRIGSSPKVTLLPTF